MTARCAASPADTIPSMSEKVCCPSCWTWSEIGKRTTCQRCGSPLILTDGRTIDTVRSTPPPPPPPPAAFGYPAVPALAGPAGFSAPVFSSMTPVTGTDWVAICRWITIGYGVLAALVLIGIGLLVQHINVPVVDPDTGITAIQTFNIGPAFAVAAILLLAVCGLFAWLTRYTTARVIFLLLDVLATLNAIAGIGGTAHAGGVGILGLVSLAFDLGYGGALVMSLLPRSEPAYA
jgi:hypothetical protein